MSDNTDQRDFWTDEAGPIWVDQRDAIDALFSPVLERTLEQAGLRSGHSVLDIGCGAGTSTLAVAERIGKTGHVTGIDISTTLLQDAHRRALGKTNVAFLDVDAQFHPFVPQSADAIVSRFGVMFFSDSKAAFENMGTALRNEGIISFACWAAISENPFFTLPAQVARQVLGPVPKSDPDGPGPFAFRDPEYVGDLITSAGLQTQVETLPEALIWTKPARELARTLCLIGPAQMALQHHGADAAMRETLLDALTEALCVYESDAGFAIPALINYVTARKAS